jgi:branched-chain amino acid transport system permease protein
MSPIRWVALIAVAYLIVILLVQNQYYQLMLTLVPVWATMGLSWNVLSGYSGLVSFGHASFFGLGAYTVALSLITFGLTPWIGIPIAAGVGALAGLVIGYPTFRLRGHCFALAMLAYPLACSTYSSGWATGGFAAMYRDNRSPTCIQRQPRGAGGPGHDGAGAVGLVTDRALALRHVAARHQAKRDCGRGGRYRHFRWKIKAIVVGPGHRCDGGFYAVVAPGRDAGLVFGMLTSAQALIVALFGGVGSAGAGDRLGHPDPARGSAAG